MYNKKVMKQMLMGSNKNLQNNMRLVNDFFFACLAKNGP